MVQASSSARLAIVGQAPGRRVHASGVPWDDPSGRTLRAWLGIGPERFYDPTAVALVPMGFCYPGHGPSGDLPPRPECAPLWHPQLWPMLPALTLTLLVGQYSQAHYLGPTAGATLTATVEAWRRYLPHYLPLPHPSPRNRPWLRKNPWFEAEVLPELQARVRSLWP